MGAKWGYEPWCYGTTPKYYLRVNPLSGASVPTSDIMLLVLHDASVPISKHILIIFATPQRGHKKSFPDPSEGSQKTFPDPSEGSKTLGGVENPSERATPLRGCAEKFCDPSEGSRRKFLPGRCERTQNILRPAAIAADIVL